ncbi:sensor histidine kinase [Streptomyces prasinus]|uniref:sensor histidine kinase n=1 Tax=Streptomyces prasinus TaxID=67345 RepID=UPI00368606D0
MPTPRDSELGRELTDVRAFGVRLVDAFDAERRRIERDLRDGAQQRLVSLDVMLGLAALDAEPDSPPAGQLAEAQEQVGLAVDELRELSRGVHPKALTDHGLAAAVENLSARSALSVTVDIRLPRRLPLSVETAAYFVIAEALTNAVKHSGSTRTEVHARLHTDPLALSVSDDGIGGTTSEAGTGLIGLADRVAGADGRFRVSSPPGRAHPAAGGAAVPLAVALARDTAASMTRSRRCFPTSVPMRRCRRTQGVGSARCNPVWLRPGSTAVPRQ